MRIMQHANHARWRIGTWSRRCEGRSGPPKQGWTARRTTRKDTWIELTHGPARQETSRRRRQRDAVACEAMQGGSWASEMTEESPLDTARAILFYITTTLLAIPLFVSMLIMHPFVLMLDKYKRWAQHFVNNVWANLTTSLFFRIQVIGRENLPPKGQPVVYVANHQSYLDIYTLFALWRPFKFISKTSNFLIPIVGWSMYLTGHIGLKRMDRRSQLDCLKTCGEMLQRGASVLFFPEGTRSDTGEMGDFRKGAFSVAKKAKVPVVPITLVGTGRLMPNGKEGVLRKGSVKMIVHPSIDPNKDADEMCKEAQEVIISSLHQ
eukprot:CAMPEP_0183824034 /NCGR_PEP_ID=MMETSP0807_2-20130328/369_1 /TAXON_ID=88271 /ORGANISM="Picocystis salinarum, Strain CCMP1897" /LENGTH=320 /DNA_ID=CAMNT_0026068945 /DNA_START=105 /DNA_END=1067 /DNA_ORIENTATION=+